MRKAQVGVAIPYLAKHQYSFLGKHTKKRAIQPISTLASEGGIPCFCRNSNEMPGKTCPERPKFEHFVREKMLKTALTQTMSAKKICKNGANSDTP